MTTILNTVIMFYIMLSDNIKAGTLVFTYLSTYLALVARVFYYDNKSTEER